MSKITDMEFLNNKYVSNTVLSGVPEKSEWTLNGFKLAYLIACEMSDYRIFIKSKSEFKNFDNEKIKEHLKSVPKSYKISRLDYQKITGVSYANVAREISKSCDDLLTKITTLPNPLDPNNRKSFEKVQWFSKAKYNDRNGEISIDIHTDMLPYFVVLVHYTKLDYQNIAGLKNLYSARIYLICKIAQNKFNETLQIKIAIDDLKKRIGLKGKYNNIPRLKSRVLNIVTDEINKKTDLNFEYELHKTGKRFTDITLKFSQKTDINNQAENLKQTDPKIENETIETSFNLSINDETLIVSSQLQAYGISKKKSLEYIKIYGVETCMLGIQKLLGEIQKNKVIQNVSGYLISCIENTGNNLSSQEIKASMDEAERLAKTNEIKKIERFYDFDAYINNNEQQILPLFLKNEAKEKLIDEIDIDMLRCLKEVVNQYSDLEKMSTYYLKFKFKDEVLNYSKIKNIVQKLEVATKEERIANLKKNLQEKKLEFEKADDQYKKIIEKEITILQVAIADLV